MTNIRMSIMSSRVRTSMPDRYTGEFSNPVGNTGRVTRETAPLARNAPARIQHPKLNTRPWSTSFAVKRRPLPERASKNARVG